MKAFDQNSILFNRWFGSPRNFQEKNGKKMNKSKTKLDLFKASGNE